MEDKNLLELKKYYSVLFNEALADIKNKNRRYRQIPNILSIVRLFSPIFIIPVAALGHITLVLIFIFIFAITDLADGIIARKYKLQSKLGEDLDAIADKIFSSTLLIAVSFSQPVLVISFLFELAIASINAKAKLKNQNPKSLMIGKIKAWFLFPIAALGILSNYININIFFNTWFIITTIMQTITTIIYLFKYRKNIEDQEKIIAHNNENH